MSSNEQLVPQVQLNGFVTSYLSTTTVGIGAGQALDSLGNNNLVLSSSVIINSAAVGANGIDTGTFAASSTYAIYVIGSSLLLSNAPTAGLISLSATAPTLPPNYDIFILVGWAFSDASVHFINFYQTGNRGVRTFYYDAGIEVITAGTQTGSFLAVSLADVVPAIDNTPVYLSASFTPATAGDYVTFRPTGSSATQANILSGVVAAKAQVASICCLSKLASSVPKIDYQNSAASGATTAYVLGFDFYV
jgi:hypothetical protein